MTDLERYKTLATKIRAHALRMAPGGKSGYDGGGDIVQGQYDSRICPFR